MLSAVYIRFPVAVLITCLLVIFVSTVPVGFAYGFTNRSNGC